jgi:hypothetical protein
VLVKYSPCGSGVPVGMPTVSPGCVTDPAKAIDIPIHVDSTPAVVTLINLLRILASDAQEVDQYEVNNATDPSMKLEAEVSSLRIIFKISRVQSHRA